MCVWERFFTLLFTCTLDLNPDIWSNGSFFLFPPFGLTTPCERSKCYTFYLHSDLPVQIKLVACRHGFTVDPLGFVYITCLLQLVISMPSVSRISFVCTGLIEQTSVGNRKPTVAWLERSCHRLKRKQITVSVYPVSVYPVTGLGEEGGRLPGCMSDYCRGCKLAVIQLLSGVFQVAHCEPAAANSWCLVSVYLSFFLPLTDLFFDWISYVDISLW